MTIKLLRLLDAAADGARATNGPDAPNLFADAAAELRRLKAIEEDVRWLLSPVHQKDDSGFTAGGNRTTTMAQDVAYRLTVGRRLGESVGIFEKREKK
ncbi:hypothetical protein TSA6c_17440 [Azospirillum sp. TSA6c]|uniref:hypothetical protein n=1 Tax=Azospirillum sp. TSA6c TaxID=709813 RepID=UPI000D6085FE|nr:hypothetical protein [Azospirillum sp. TSA6c]PWC48205.1 hypothetical protein TSA6c_17440 [Azospirillum sp. TSA6c]